MAAVIGVGGAVVGLGGLVLQLRSARKKEDEELARQRSSLERCLVSDIRAILRVIDVARIIDHMLASCVDPGARLPMGSGPRKEDYFVLYAAVAGDVGKVDEKIGSRATAFYVLLKGSRDVAESFERLDRLKPRTEKVTSSIALTSRMVLQMLEHMHRHGLIAILLGRKQPRVVVSKLDREDQFASQILRTWMVLTMLNRYLDWTARPSLAEFLGNLGRLQQEGKESIMASALEAEITLDLEGVQLAALFEGWTHRLQQLNASMQPAKDIALQTA